MPTLQERFDEAFQRQTNALARTRQEEEEVKNVIPGDLALAKQISFYTSYNHITFSTYNVGAAKDLLDRLPFNFTREINPVNGEAKFSTRQGNLQIVLYVFAPICKVEEVPLPRSEWKWTNKTKRVVDCSDSESMI